MPYLDDLILYVNVNPSNIEGLGYLTELSDSLYDLLEDSHKGVADVLRNFIATFPQIDSLEKLAAEIPKHINSVGNFAFTNHDGGTIICCCWRKPLLIILKAIKDENLKLHMELEAAAKKFDALELQFLHGDEYMDKEAGSTSKRVQALLKTEAVLEDFETQVIQGSTLSDRTIDEVDEVIEGLETSEKASLEDDDIDWSEAA